MRILSKSFNLALCALFVSLLVANTVTASPAGEPAELPTEAPTMMPTYPEVIPIPIYPDTEAPTDTPTAEPTEEPTPAPTSDPTPAPTFSPTEETEAPTPPPPTEMPTSAPTGFGPHLEVSMFAPDDLSCSGSPSSSWLPVGCSAVDGGRSVMAVCTVGASGSPEFSLVYYNSAGCAANQLSIITGRAGAGTCLDLPVDARMKVNACAISQTGAPSYAPTEPPTPAPTVFRPYLEITEYTAEQPCEDVADYTMHQIGTCTHVTLMDAGIRATCSNSGNGQYSYSVTLYENGDCSGGVVNTYTGSLTNDEENPAPGACVTLPERFESLTFRPSKCILIDPAITPAPTTEAPTALPTEEPTLPTYAPTEEPTPAPTVHTEITIRTTFDLNLADWTNEMSEDYLDAVVVSTALPRYLFSDVRVIGGSVIAIAAIDNPPEGINASTVLASLAARPLDFTGTSLDAVSFTQPIANEAAVVDSSGGSNGLTGGAIAGIVIAVVFLVSCIIGMVFYIWRQSRESAASGTKTARSTARTTEKLQLSTVPGTAAAAAPSGSDVDEQLPPGWSKTMYPSSVDGVLYPLYVHRKLNLTQWEKPVYNQTDSAAAQE